MVSEKDYKIRILPPEVREALAALVGRWGLANILDGLAFVSMVNRDATEGRERGGESWAWNESTNALTDAMRSTASAFRGVTLAGSGLLGDPTIRHCVNCGETFTVCRCGRWDPTR